MVVSSFGASVFNSGFAAAFCAAFDVALAFGIGAAFGIIFRVAVFGVAFGMMLVSEAIFGDDRRTIASDHSSLLLDHNLSASI
jgi:hypothetical protein